MHRSIRVIIPALFVAGVVSPALAQTFPSKPIRIIVPYAPGGATDIVARVLAPKLTEGLGQTVIVDNRPGGATFIGSDLVAKAPPDGHTLLLANIALAANPALFRKIPYDAAKDFAPITRIVTVPMLLVIHPSVPARSVKQLIAFARTRPGAFNYGSAGNGSANHLTMAVFASMAKLDLVHVPYKGGAPAFADLMAGQLTMMFGTTLGTLQYVKTGRLVGLGVSSAQRSAAAPDMPTVSEAGLPGYDVSEWQMLLTAANTPAAVINRLNEETLKALASPEANERIAGVGAIPSGGTPAEAAKYLAGELARWARVAKEAAIKPVD